MGDGKEVFLEFGKLVVTCKEASNESIVILADCKLFYPYSVLE